MLKSFLMLGLSAAVAAAQQPTPPAPSAAAPAAAAICSSSSSATRATASSRTAAASVASCRFWPNVVDSSESSWLSSVSRARPASSSRAPESTKSRW